MAIRFRDVPRRPRSLPAGRTDNAANAARERATAVPPAAGEGRPPGPLSPATRTRAERRRRPAADPGAYRDELLAVGRDAGLDAVGVTEASGRGPDARRRLEERKAAGLPGGMAFTYRNPARSTDPTRSLPDACTLVVGAHPYRRRRLPVPPTRGRPDRARSPPTPGSSTTNPCATA